MMMMMMMMGDGVNELPRMVGKQKAEITNKLPLSYSPFFSFFFFPVLIVSGRLHILGVSRKFNSQGKDGRGLVL